ncbi:MAG: ABC transporter permease [Alphaproteobacteria bacterium]|nr:ABC transporter permease [Alphaproteobacteria bacterium]
MGLLARIALAHLRGRVRQSLVSVLGVATGVGFFIAVAALMEGSQRDFIATLVDAIPHITIRDEFRNPAPQPIRAANPDAAVQLDGLKPKDELRGIRNARARLAALDSISGLVAAPSLRGQVVLRYGGKDMGVSLIGIEPARERRVSQLEADLVQGRLEDLHTAANAIIVGTVLAEKLGARVGDTLLASSAAGIRLRVKVVGLFRTGVMGVDRGQAYALLKKVQVLQERPNVINEIRVKVGDVYQAAVIARDLEARLGYRAESWDEANEGFLDALRIRNIILYSVVGAILLVASFGIFNIISTVTYEKARDIAILKALGFAERDIRWIFTAEGLVVGAIGAALGWGLGYLLCRVLSQVEITLQSETRTLPLYEAPAFYALALGFALASAGFAAYLPARRAARLNPVDIVRGAQ